MAEQWWADEDAGAVVRALFDSCPECHGSLMVLDDEESSRQGYAVPMQCQRCAYLNAGLHPVQGDEDLRVAGAVLAALAPTVERIRREARAEALREAIVAHRNLHPTYGSTAVCRGGIGGQMVTEHCAQVCPNPVHDEARQAWEAVETRYFDATRIEAGDA